MDLEINPFETIGLAPHPHQEPIDCYHNLEKLLTIIETQPERKNWTKRVRRFFPKRTRSCHTNACGSTFHFNPGHHCRLCKNIVCDECFMHVPERIVDTLHRQKGQGNLNNKNIKVCQACNERVKEEWLLYSIDIPDGVSIQKLDALKQKAEYRIQNYNTAVREVR
ncbi:uncharacterized protein [Antedon mediterranea]|uniref:uncharacterized protein n=1 Tax=Antedon mediterranea TaxID=105859 RepID=UPI003AF9BF26